MDERKRHKPVEEIPEEWKRPGGPADYDESGGTGLEPGRDDDVLGGGPSGGDEDPIGEPGIPDEVTYDPEKYPPD